MTTGPHFAVRLPPSARRLLFVLHDTGPLTISEASARAALRPRTIRFALAALRRAGLVRDLPQLGDLRRKRVSAVRPLAGTAEEGPADR